MSNKKGMRIMKKAFCAMTAALMFISAAPANLIASADAEEKIKPVFQYFNPADVNGSVVIVLPEEIHATAEITFDSPEGRKRYILLRYRGQRYYRRRRFPRL